MVCDLGYGEHGNPGLLANIRRLSFQLAWHHSGSRSHIHHRVLVDQPKPASAHANKRAELDYEVNVRTYREIQEIKANLRVIEQRLKPNSLE